MPLRLVSQAEISIEAPGSGDERALTNDEVVGRLHDILRGRMDVTPLVCRKLEVGDLHLDLISREVSRGGESIALTGAEFEVLRYLMRHQRHALSREQIRREVWRYDFGGRCSVVDVYLYHLRKKIDAGRSPMIHAGEFGYLLMPANSCQPNV